MNLPSTQNLLPLPFPRKLLHFFRLWLPVVTLFGILVFLSSADRGYRVPVNHVTWSDKLPHLLAFGLIGTLVLRALPNSLSRQKLWSYAILITASFGLIDETLQFFNRSRTGDALDWLADLLGAALAVTGYLYVRWYKKILEFPLLNLIAPFASERKAATQ